MILLKGLDLQQLDCSEYQKQTIIVSSRKVSGTMFYGSLIWDRVSTILSQHQLSSNNCSIEVVLVLMTIVSKLMSQTPEEFDSPIDCFMPTSYLLLCTLLALTDIIVRTPDCRISMISGVRFNHFSRSKHRLHEFPIDIDIRICSSWKRSMTRNDFASLNTSADSVSKPCWVKFVTVVSRIKWISSPLDATLGCWILFVEALEINAVMVDLACPTFIVSQSIFESDLRWQEKVRLEKVKKHWNQIPLEQHRYVPLCSGSKGMPPWWAQHTFKMLVHSLEVIFVAFLLSDSACSCRATRACDGVSNLSSGDRGVSIIE